MIKRVLIDTGVILDVALKREPFYKLSTIILSIIENDIALGFVTSICISNLYYILRKFGGDKKSRLFISKLISFLTIIPTDHKIIIESIKSKFNDFEDAIQNYTAICNQCECIITRNIEDFRESEITIYSPKEFIELFK